MRGTPALLLSVLLLTGCTADSTATAAPDHDADVAVVADDLRFTPDRLEIPAGELTTIHLSNDGGIVHDLVLDSGWESGGIDPGQAAVVTLGPLEQTTVAWCSVPGHRAAGMELELVVVPDDH